VLRSTFNHNRPEITRGWIKLCIAKSFTTNSVHKSRSLLVGKACSVNEGNAKSMRHLVKWGMNVAIYSQLFESMTENNNGDKHFMDFIEDRIIFLDNSV
jgi:hypothetical protein